MSFEGAAISLGATVISLAFASLVFAQWLGRRKPYQLAWSLGLGLYAIAAFMQFLAEAYGWSVTVYKIYYLVAAPLVAVLGIGSVFLVHRRAGIGFALYTVAIFIGFAAAVAGATVNTDALASAIPVAGTALPDNVRIFSPPVRLAVEDRRGSRRQSQDGRPHDPPLRRGRVDERDREGTPRVRRGGRPRRLGGPTSRRSWTTRPGMGLASGRAVLLIHPATEGGACLAPGPAHRDAGRQGAAPLRGLRGPEVPERCGVSGPEDRGDPLRGRVPARCIPRCGRHWREHECRSGKTPGRSPAEGHDTEARSEPLRRERRIPRLSPEPSRRPLFEIPQHADRIPP